MPHSFDQACCSADFGVKYEQFLHPAFRELEWAVLGTDYCGTSWTTREQADQIIPALGLDVDSRLLEVGAGAGWPAVYLSWRTDCRTTLLDIPDNALAVARDRAEADGIGNRIQPLVAVGEQLPFGDAVFDAISHSDVLCCLDDKLGMVRECRRVARDGARMLFYVIAPAEGLNMEDLAEAIKAGPPAVGMEMPYEDMLLESGWRMDAISSVTHEYLECLRTMVHELENTADTFRDVMGPSVFEDELANRLRQVAAVGNGLLVREAYLVTAV